MVSINSNKLAENPIRQSSKWDQLLTDINSLMKKSSPHYTPRVFISYAWEDTSTQEGVNNNSKLQRYLEKLRDDLQSAGISVFLDISHMHGDLKTRMNQYLTESDVVISILTPRFKQRAVASNTNLAFEYKLTLEKLKSNPYSVIPLLYSGSFIDAVPEDLYSCLIRDASDIANYNEILIGVQRPLGVLPAIYNISFENPEYKKLIYEWRIKEINALPPLNPRFIDRKILSKKLEKIFFADNNANARVQVLSGSAGVGKSELALQVAHNIINQYDVVRWLPCGHNSNSLKLEFELIATKLGIDIKGMNLKELISYTYKRLDPYKWLFIFDGVENFAEVKDYIPSSLEQGQNILITSRSRNWNVPIIIEPFNENEAFEFAKLIKTDITLAEVRDIGETIGYLPLALSQALNYINKIGISVHSYLDLYKNKGVKVLQNVPNTDPNNYPYSVFETIKISLQKIKLLSESSTKILVCCAYLNSDDIPITWFINEGLLKNEKELHQALSLLYDYSLIEYSKYPDHISVQKLVQSAIRQEYKKEQIYVAKLLPYLATAVQNSYLEAVNVNENDKKVLYLLSHIKSLKNFKFL